MESRILVRAEDGGEEAGSTDAGLVVSSIDEAEQLARDLQNDGRIVRVWFFDNFAPEAADIGWTEGIKRELRVGADGRLVVKEDSYDQLAMARRLGKSDELAWPKRFAEAVERPIGEVIEVQRGARPTSVQVIFGVIEPTELYLG